MLITCLLTLPLAFHAGDPAVVEPAAPLFEASLAEPSSQAGSFATRIPYTYVETGYGKLNGYTADVVTADLALFSLAASYEISQGLHVFGGGARATDIEQTPEVLDDARVDSWFGGIGIHDYVSPNLNGFFRVSYAGTDIRGVEKGTSNELFRSSNGFVYSLGFRYFAWNSVELSATGLLSDKTDAKVNIELGALWRMTESLGLGVVYSRPGNEDDGDSLGVGARWYF